MTRIVPFYAADQAIVDNLCGIIRKLYPHISDIPLAELKLSDRDADLLTRIMKDEA